MAGPMKPSDPNRRDNNQNGGGDDKKRSPWSFFSIVMWAVMLVLLLHMCSSSMERASVQTVPYSTFYQWVEDGYVDRVDLASNAYTFTLKPNAPPLEEYLAKLTESYGKGGLSQLFGPFDPNRLTGVASENVKFQTAPLNQPDLISWLSEHGVERFEAELITTEQYMLSAIVSYVLPVLAMVVAMIFIYRYMFKKMGSGGGFGGIGGVGKSNAKVYVEKKTGVTFKDVAGQDEAKESLEEIIDFLHNPGKYTEIGAKLPKGALLVGPPGTGKTLLAKAVAGEANVPFFSISGSDFVEMFVGVGASRVRDLFEQAKQKAPCILFIDEIDAIGRARGKNAGFSGNDERENTLNQLLTEMDGFQTNQGVIVLAATNRADILDKALMRAGRFDRQIEVGLPDVKEREEIFGVHLRSLRLDPDLDRTFLAKQTPGFSGADIANVCNEAALIAARHDKKFVSKEDFLAAIDRIVGGLERRNKIISDEEKRVIAYHEAGHATVSWILEHASPLIKVTIIPRGKALGAAWYLPEERQITTRAQLLDEMAATLGGRVSEQLTFGHVSTGALNDLERVTKQAYAMVAYYGMSEAVGTLSYYDSTGQNDMALTKPYSEQTAQLLDAEARRMIDEAYALAERVLREHADGLRTLAERLLEREVVFTEDVEQIFGRRRKDILRTPRRLRKAGRRGGERCGPWRPCGLRGRRDRGFGCCGADRSARCAGVPQCARCARSCGAPG